MDTNEGLDKDSIFCICSDPVHLFSRPLWTSEGEGVRVKQGELDGEYAGERA